MQPLDGEPSDGGAVPRLDERERSELELQRDAMVSEGGGTASLRAIESAARSKPSSWSSFG